MLESPKSSFLHSFILSHIFRVSHELHICIGYNKNMIIVHVSCLFFSPNMLVVNYDKWSVKGKIQDQKEK